MTSPIGHCLCGGVRFAFDRYKVRDPDICHCESCRRATAAPFAGTFAVPDTAWRWTREKPATYASSPGVTRSFCATCGTAMAYATEALPGETHFFIATLVDPTLVVPKAQAFTEEAVPWITEALSLPEKD